MYAWFASWQAYLSPIPSMIPGQPPLPEVDGGGLRAAPSPLGPRGGKPPTLAQLYAAIISPDRGWLDALQVPIVFVRYCICSLFLL